MVEKRSRDNADYNVMILDRLHQFPGLNGDEIGTYVASAVTPEQQLHLRRAFRKTIIAKESWGSAAKEIRGRFSHVLSPREQEAIQAQKGKVEAKRAAIKEAIAAGDTPWKAHVEQNERDELHPYLVGFYAIDGKIKPLYSDRFFVSYAGRKAVHLLKAEIRTVGDATLLEGTHWDALPPELQQMHLEGKTLVTTNHNLYSLPDEKLDELAESDDPNALLGHIDQTIADAEDGYYLLHYADTDKAYNGRSSVLLQKKDGEMKPVVVEVDGRENIIEMKGSGVWAGGFPGKHKRAGEEAITGGAKAEEGENEVARLAHTGPGEPKAAGALIYGDQSSIIRFSESTIRASFEGPDLYPDIHDPDVKKRVIAMYGEEPAKQIGAADPYFLDRSNHTENILLFDNTFTWTDYCDHIAFGDHKFPEFLAGHFLTPQFLLEMHIRSFAKTLGKTHEDLEYFIEVLRKSFEQKGKNVTLDASDDPYEVAWELWSNGGLAYEVYKARKGSAYLPEGPVDAVREKLDKLYDILPNHDDDQATFVQFVHKTETEFHEVIDALAEEEFGEQYKEDLDLLIETIRERGMLSSATTIGELSRLMQEASSPSYYHNIRTTLQKARILSEPYMVMESFIDGEEEIVSGAKVTAPDEAKAHIAQATDEVMQKYHDIDALKTAKGLYRLYMKDIHIMDALRIESYAGPREKEHVVFKGQELPEDITVVMPQTEEELALFRLMRTSFRLSQGDAYLQGLLFELMKVDGALDSMDLPDEAPEYLYSLSVPKKHKESKGDYITVRQNVDQMYGKLARLKNLQGSQATRELVMDKLLTFYARRDLKFVKEGRAGRAEGNEVVTDSENDPRASWMRRFILNGEATGVAYFDQMHRTMRESLLEQVSTFDPKDQRTRERDLFMLIQEWERHHPDESFIPQPDETVALDQGEPDLTADAKTLEERAAVQKKTPNKKRNVK